MHDDVICHILNIYSEIDCQIAAFKNITGLYCPSGCGKCCASAKVEATVLEMLPIAEELFRRGESLQWLDRIHTANESGTCVFYHPGPDTVMTQKGCCLMYSRRPVVCRMFGFATVKNKNGKPELALCRYHKESSPFLAESVRKAILNGLPVPSFTEFSIRISCLDPCIGTQLVPINRALRLALEREGIRIQMTGAQYADYTLPLAYVPKHDAIPPRLAA